MESKILSALSKTDWGTAKAILRGSLEIDPERESHLLFVVMPSTSPNSSVVYLPTSYLKSKVQLMAAARRGGFIDELFSAALAHSESKSLAGELLEIKGHLLLPKGGTWKLSPMTDRRNNTEVPKWITYVLDDGESENFTLPPQETRWFSIDETELDLTSNTYYRPYKRNHPSFDAFIFDTDVDLFVVFQLTVSEDHDVKPRGLQFLLELLRHHKNNTKLVAASLKILFINVVTIGMSPEVKIPASSNWLSIQWNVKALELETQTTQLSPVLEKERLDDIGPFLSGTVHDKSMTREDVGMEVD